MKLRHWIAVLVGALAIAVAVPSIAQEAVDTAAADRLGACVETSRVVHALFLVDESRSLRTNPGTDPEDRRVEGIRAGLTGLARLAAAPIDGDPVTVETRLVAFGSEYRDVGDGWRELDEGSVDDLLETAGSYADLDDADDTDYVTAFLEARDDLAAKSAEVTEGGGEPPCQLIVFFTDGRYDLKDRLEDNGLPAEVEYAPGVRLDEAGGSDRALEIGREYLCRPDGLADELRSNGVQTFTIGLDSANLDEASRRFLEAVTIGSSDGTRCGVSGSRETGFYASAADSDRLIYVFGSWWDAADLRFCPEQGQTTCTFDVVAGLTGFVLQTTAPEDGIDLELAPPGGARVRFEGDGTERVAVGSASVVARHLSDRSVEVDVTLDPEAPDGFGTWGLSFLDRRGPVEGQGLYRVLYRAELRPDVIDLEPLYRGVEATLELGFEAPSGEAIIDSPLLEGAVLTAELRDVDAGTVEPLEVRDLGDGRFETSLTPSRHSASAQAELVLRASFAPGGDIELPDASRTVTIDLLPPADFPAIADADLLLPSIEGDGSTSGVITLVGSELADGCAWFEPGTIDLPGDGDARTTLDPEGASLDTCVPVALGERRDVRVDVAPDARRIGRASGDVLVHLRSDASDETQDVRVAIAFDMTVAPDVVTTWLLFAGLMVLGCGLPILLLHLLNRLNARFTPSPQTLVSLALNVDVRRDGVVGSEGVDLTAPFERFEWVATTGTAEEARRFSVGGVRLRAIPSGSISERTFSLFQGPFGVATTTTGPVLAGADVDLRPFSNGAHEVPLDLDGTWLFTPTARLSDGTAGYRGLLVLLINGGGAHDAGSRILIAAMAALPSAIERMPEPRPSDTSDPSNDLGPTPPTPPTPPDTEPTGTVY